MIYSMTGFASAEASLPNGTLHLELRSVNHRYLEVAFRLPDEFKALEPALREAIARRLSRGKVECRLQLVPLEAGRVHPELNVSLLRQLVALDETVRAHLAAAQGLRVVDILRWPGMLGADTPNAEALRGATLDLLNTALAQLTDTRGREGDKLKALLRERSDQMEAITHAVAPKIPALVKAYQERLGARMREAMAGCDEERIRQELALFAQKIDVDEELARLKAHISELRRILDAGGIVGKRLDFLMQELHREANTLGSKSIALDTSQAAMELKVLIEQMREQVQNIE
ncbi:MAG: YicC family protein [Betaproteobacteria bacterium]|nr:YicC family protein [Betaproteobacteria bacterium]